MNYGWLTPSTDVLEYQRVVRHEFGHALGMIHEHQNPSATGRIPWDRPRVYAYYAEQGWSKDDVDSNIFDVYDTDMTNFTTFDPRSIMQYAIPEELTIGTYSVGWNTELSPTDVSFMRAQYPSADSDEVAIEVGAPPTVAALGGRSEIDTFRFEVASAGTHIVTSTGALRHHPHRARARGPGHGPGVGRRPWRRSQRAHRAPSGAGGVLADRAPPPYSAVRDLQGAGEPSESQSERTKVRVTRRAT